MSSDTGHCQPASGTNGAVEGCCALCGIELAADGPAEQIEGVDYDAFDEALRDWDRVQDSLDPADEPGEEDYRVTYRAHPGCYRIHQLMGCDHWAWGSLAGDLADWMEQSPRLLESALAAAGDCPHGRAAVLDSLSEFTRAAVGAFARVARQNPAV